MIRCILLIVILLLSPGLALAQDRIEYGENWDEEGRFVAAWQDAFWVDANGNDIEQHTSFQDGLGDPFQIGNRIRWIRDADGLIVRTETYRPDRENKSVFNLDHVQESITSEDGLITDLIDQFRDADGQFTNLSRQRTVRDADSRLLSSVLEFWIDGTWVAGSVLHEGRRRTSERSDAMYFPDSVQSISSVWSFNAQDWVPQRRSTVMIQDPGAGLGPVTEERRIDGWTPGGWVTAFHVRTTTTWISDAVNETEEIVRENRTNGEWEFSTRVRSITNRTSDDIIRQSWRWNNGAWSPDSWTTEFHSVHGLETQLSYRWDEAGLTPSGRYELRYDDQGRELYRASSVYRFDRWATIFTLETSFPTATAVAEVPDPTDVTWEVFPNPTTDEVRIRYHAQEARTSVAEVLDVTGRVVLRQALSPGERGVHEAVIDLSSLGAGVYLVVMPNASHQMSTTVVKL